MYLGSAALGSCSSTDYLHFVAVKGKKQTVYDLELKQKKMNHVLLDKVKENNHSILGHNVDNFQYALEIRQKFSVCLTRNSYSHCFIGPVNC